jgi:hypothetical protein
MRGEGACMGSMRLQIAAPLCAGAVLGLAGPAAALPGQSLSAFTSWAANKTVLAGISRYTGELSGRPAFRLLTADHGIAWQFIALSTGSTIRSEYLGVSQVGKAPGSQPIRHDGRGYGFAFFASLYGRDVAGDYRAARLVATIKDPTNGQVTRYYRGRRYGYAEANGLSLKTFAAFATDLALARRCAKSPQDCNE